MAVERSELLRVAALARLHLQEAEAECLVAQLDGILEHVERLLAIDTAADVPAMTPAAASVGRAAVPDPDPLCRPLSELAPGWRDGYFTVPRVLAP